MAAIEGLKHAECVHQKLHFRKFLWTVCSTMQSTVESMMTWMMSTAFWLGVAETACRVGVLGADSMNTCMSTLSNYSAAPIGFLESASFSEQVLPVSGFLSLPFLTRFPHMRCHIQGQGFGNKMYISELFTVVGYLHTAGFKNRRGIKFAKCMFSIAW